MKIRHYIIFLLLLVQNNYGQSKSIAFRHYAVRDGLSQSTVLNLLQDRLGFIWIGTADGLNRFDGYTFKTFRHIPDDETTLSSSIIRAMLQDSKGNIWLGTSNGLNRLNNDLETFTHYTNDKNDPKSLSHDVINCLFEDEQGNLWVGTSNGLNRFSSKDSTFSRYFNEPNNTESISNNTIRALAQDNLGKFWVGTSNGLNEIDIESGISKKYFYTPEDPRSISNNQINVILKDGLGFLWIGTDHGLNLLQPGGTFTRFLHDPDNSNSLSRDNVKALFEDSDGLLWIGTYRGGISLLDRTTETFTHIRHDPRNHQSLSNDMIFSIIQDHSGMIWVGTLAGGVNVINPNQMVFQTYRQNPDSEQSLKDNLVWSILEDSQGNVWIGSNTGLTRFDSSMNNIRQYAHDPEDSTSLVFPIVRSLYEDKKGNLWFGHDFGLSLLTPENRETGIFIGIRNDPLDSNMITYGGVLSITELSTDSSGLWFSGLTGVKRYVPDDGTFTHIRPDAHQSVPSISREVLSIYEAPSMPGSFWLATNAGLKKYDARTGELTLYNHRLNDSKSISSDFINSIYEASFLPGILWIGTYGGGLNRFDINTGDFSHFTVEDGLPSNVVIGFVEDSSQYIWFSTHNGISRFDPRQDVPQFVNFDESDGLQDNEFNADAFFTGKSGRIYFGGINGFTTFDPKDVKINENPPSIIITDLLINNASVSHGGGRSNDDRTILSKSVSLTDAVTLFHKDRVITLEFVAIDYINPAKNLYKYMLEGFDQDWVDAGTRRFVTYTNLKPGDYIFRVAGSNNHGVWNANDTSLVITVTPPIWMTLWFRSISIILFISVVYFAYRKRISALDNKRIDLEKTVQERSRAAKELQNALDEVETLKNRLQTENIYLRDEIKLEHNFTNIISQNEAFKEVLYQVEQVTATDTTVFILGESGTGKELIARAVHALSDRKDRPLVKIDCASLPATLIESELFGHEKGAFTGATKKKIGRIELANGGTLFLDEIGELPLELQPKLLRILQENQFERIGGVNTIKVDVRIIAATNRNIKHELAQGRFREDLYFRLNVFPIQIPPLRERRDDIELLVRHFSSKYSTKMGKQVKSINRETMEKLVDYDWPGNIRELENVIERGIVISTGNELIIGDWFDAPTNGLKISEGASSLEDMEKQYILKVLESTNWRVSGPKGAAKILKMNASTLFSRMDKFGISRK